MDKHSRLSCTLANNKAGIAAVVDMAHAYAKSQAFSALISQMLPLCLDEMLNNIMHHHVTSMNGHIVVDVYVESNCLKVTIKDNGSPFNPAYYAISQSNESNSVAMDPHALQTVQSFYDGVHYHRDGGYNVIMLSKCLN